MNNAILTCLKKYSDFSGRASRSEYWYFALFYILINYMAGAVAGAFNSLYISGVIELVFLIPMIAVGVRRMHDQNKAGWYYLIPIYSFILEVSAGDQGDNRFGPPAVKH